MKNIFKMTLLAGALTLPQAGGSAWGQQVDLSVFTAEGFEILKKRVSSDITAVCDASVAGKAVCDASVVVAGEVLNKVIQPAFSVTVTQLLPAKAGRLDNACKAD